MRSQHTTNRPRRTLFSSFHGSVRVYTRFHVNGCALRDTNDNHCSCPKWIYAKARDSKPPENWKPGQLQKTAGTPSFTEACEQAQKILRGFDPEIRAARELVAPARSGGITVEAALDRYFAILERRKLSESYLNKTVYVVFRRRTDRTHRSRRGLNLSLLDFLDRRAPGARPILLEEITGAVLDEWVAGWGTNDLTSRQWRCVASGFFSWAQGRELIPRVPSFDEGERIKKGNRCGHLEDAQYDTLIETLPFHRYWKMPETYVARMRAFLDLGRWAGMALTDIIHFTPSLHLSADNVVSYQRRKTDEWAEVLLDPTVAARLRSIPPEPGSLADQPMNFAGRKMFSIEELWRRRFRMLCFRAGIRQIVTEDRAIRKPHPHMLRDTCAIDAISRGVDLVNVARMLGHKNVSMTQRCYLFWIEKRSKHCIEDQRVALARVKIAAPTAIERVIVRDYDTNRFQVHRSLTLPNSHR